MIHTFIKMTFAVCLGVVLSACQMMDGSRKDKAKVADLSMQAKSNQDRQVVRAVRLLETGKQQDAKQLLNEVLLFNPKHDKAVLLNRQLNEPSEKFFGTNKSISYSIKSGDSLGKIAHKWLGESLYFVGLAKLNQITNPSRLERGKTIKIPLIGPAVTIQKQGRRSRANVALLKQYKSGQDFNKGLRKANTLFVLEKDLPGLIHEQQRILDAYAGKSNSINQKRQMLESVTKIAESSRNKEQLGVYQRFIKAQNRTLFLDESQELFAQKQYMQAARKLASAKRLDAKINSKTSVFRMEKLLINKLHEQAVIFYRNHALKKALTRWDLILELQPSHELAQKYKVRANKLIEKLDQY